MFVADSSVRRPRGSLFQIRRPRAPKLLSPKLLCTAHMLPEEDRRDPVLRIPKRHQKTPRVILVMYLYVLMYYPRCLLVTFGVFWVFVRTQYRRLPSEMMDVISQVGRHLTAQCLAQSYAYLPGWWHPSHLRWQPTIPGHTNTAQCLALFSSFSTLILLVGSFDL